MERTPLNTAVRKDRVTYCLGIVTSDGLSLRCRHDPAIEVGTSVVAYVRPEDVQVLADGQDGFDNVIEGTIDRVIFEGPTAQVRVDIGGREFRADVTGSDRVTLGASKGRVRVSESAMSRPRSSGMPRTPNVPGVT